MSYAIMVAWTEQVQVTAKLGQIDIGKPHTYRTELKPYAIVWRNSGDAADIEKAHAFCAKERESGGNHRVLTYAKNPDNILDIARRDVYLADIAAFRKEHDHG